MMERPLNEPVKTKAVERNAILQKVLDFVGAVGDLLGVYLSSFKKETREDIDIRENLNYDEKRKIDADRLGAGPWF